MSGFDLLGFFNQCANTEKMKVQIWVLTCLLSWFNSCRDKPLKPPASKDIYIASSSFKANSIISEIAQRFLDSIKADNEIKEMTINRLYEDEYIITFRARPNTAAYFKENHPLFIYKVNDHDSVFIYSGIEPLIKGNNSYIDPNFRDTVPTYFCVRFLLKKGKYVLDQICNDPYFPPPKYIEPPEINVEKYDPDPSN